MDFLDIENYENLMLIHKLNKDIYILKLEINEFYDKKQSNIYFLNLQQELFNSTVQKKFNMLKKFNYRIIKNILYMHFLQKKNNEINEIKIQNKQIINDIHKTLLYFSIDNFNNKKSIEKILNKYNTIINTSNENLSIINKLDINTITSIKDNFRCKILKNLDSNNSLNNYYIFYNYLLQYNFYNDIKLILTHYKFIYKQQIRKYKLNIEYKEYFKFKQNSIKQITKYKNINEKNKQLQIKNTKRFNLLLQKTKNIKNKYLFIQKDIISYEKRNIKAQSTISKNIHELNIRISIKSKQLKECEQEIELCNKNIELLNELNGNILLTDENCAICLETIKKGIMTSCKHYYHYGCINLYIFNILQQNSKLDIICPICRQYI